MSNYRRAPRGLTIDELRQLLTQLETLDATGIQVSEFTYDDISVQLTRYDDQREGVTLHVTRLSRVNAVGIRHILTTETTEMTREDDEHA